ncbi:uncharacterized protein LOC100846635 [Brachypodium distachyon]|uniref:PHD-type domain-containing protein n=1 Tax=Brachypodium distachyon TaxID=15368 RepID=A0A0Q3L2U1_BRADI|nr:uncharacterized protein LOC100846635 [Brachypodium distachyon]KQJ86829.1 hypothetical protein BRADI_4g07957v3 [Brachypodium distachyon]PNT62780.1 hypothetical protein BRADI_4g07957v3 [Brachypodium distachyon]|eukprot:XP_010237286.1 uncharacterized protein LOC100846635 [Brachypodium distachyon]
MNTMSSDDESAEEVEDVKVCDICGDVGEEEKLAVCNRCNDGAEHIYCMRVMMEEVPEGEWFCEDCQTEVEFEKNKKTSEKTQVKVGTSKEESIEGKISEPANAGQSRSPSENEMTVDNAGKNERNKANKDVCMVAKRKEEEAGVTSVAIQNVSEPGGLSIVPDSSKRMPLSRASSSRFDGGKGKQPTPQIPTLLASSAAKNQAPPLIGQLSKSSSFNNSKVPKVKQLMNEIPQKPKTLKDLLSCNMKKEGPTSFSTKSASFKKPKPREPANKAESSILPPAEVPILMNSPVSRNVNNDSGTSILGCPSITGSVVPVQSKTESAAQCLTTGNNMADSSDLGREQGARNSHENSELNKSLLTNAHASITSTSADRSSGILSSGARRDVSRNSGASHRNDKIKNPSGLRPGASSSSRTIRCQRCNELGHSTQFCAVDKLSLSGIKPSSECNMKDSSVKRNKTSEAGNDLVATEKATSRLADQSEHILKCDAYHDPLSSTDNSNLKFSQAVPAMTGRSVHSSSTMSSDSVDKSIQGFSPVDTTIVSTVPELDYIWQGDFELWRTGRSPELCDGFQAHLSCSASPKVLEVAKKFPSKVQLEELPRQCSWPTQFQENGPTYDNIGVFFFARDTQSYQNHYSKLVQNMLDKDLALRGNIETAELLIFPSNILTKNSQRWNMLYFLWGVFRVKRKDHWNIRSDVPISTGRHNMNDNPLAVDLHPSSLTSSCSSSGDQNNGAEPDCNLVKPATCADHQCLHPSEANYQVCSNGRNSLCQPVDGRDLTNNRSTLDCSGAPARKHQKLAYQESQNKIIGSSGGYAGGEFFDVNKVPVTCSIPFVHEEGNGNADVNLHKADTLTYVDHENTIEANSGPVVPVMHASGSAQKRNVEMADWTNGVNESLEHKKIKLDNVSSTADSSVSENIGDGRLSSKIHPLTTSSVDDCIDNKAMAGTCRSNGKCIFPLDLNVVDDPVPGNIGTIMSSDGEDLPKHDARDLKLELGDNTSPVNPMFPFLSPMVEEKQNMGDTSPTDASAALSLSLAFPESKEQA